MNTTEIFGQKLPLTKQKLMAVNFSMNYTQSDFLISLVEDKLSEQLFEYIMLKVYKKLSYSYSSFPKAKGYDVRCLMELLQMLLDDEPLYHHFMARVVRSVKTRIAQMPEEAKQPDTSVLDRYAYKFNLK